MWRLLLSIWASICLVGCDDKTNSDVWGDCSDIPEFVAQPVAGMDVSAAFANETPIVTEAVFQVRFTLAESEVNFGFGKWQLSLWPKAYALSCVAAKINERVVSVNITSDQGFDESHPAGASLNDLFRMAFRDVLMADYLYENPIYFSGFDVRLVQMPILSKTHRFTFTLVLDTGAEFVSVTEPQVFE